MSLCGRYVNTFGEASHAVTVDVSMNEPGLHFFFDVVKVTPKVVSLRSQKDGTGWLLKVRRKRKGGREFATYEFLPGIDRVMFGRTKPRRFEVFPFKDDRQRY